MSRLLIVSNRLPVSVSVNRGRVALGRSTGGLATGLERVHRDGDSLWIGWPGTQGSLGAELDASMHARMAARRLVPVHLEPEEVSRFYEGFANEVLWPSFHYLLDRVPIEIQDWQLYEQINDRFAEVIARHHRPGDLVWIHDYHLMRLPALLRARVPSARIGFFLHIPFPPSDLFRTLPGRRPLLEGILGADLVGFHTAGYLRHFAASTLRILGLPVEIDRVEVGGRTVRVGVFPMSVDAAHFAALAATPRVSKDAEALRVDPRCQILVGIDRLDYTKGIPRRLLAFERLLARHPELHGRVRLVQVASPSRSVVRAYREFRATVDRLIGRIHGAFATPSWAPVHYIHRSFSERQVAALYRAADVMLVTPIRDGMNLVAKEFVASRVDDEGVLVLSEFAGAADELAGALMVNPYDLDEAANTFHRALTMAPEERQRRMRMMREHVARHDVYRWTRRFIEALERSSTVTSLTGPADLPGPPGAEALASLREARRLVLLLDYDGTLVPFASRPELAGPDPALLDLLTALTARPATEVHIVSGRTRESLSGWFGQLAAHLHAEHGLASRSADGTRWRSLALPDLSWRERVAPILAQFAERTPGAFVERKGAGLAWHWRVADPEFAAHQADELRLHLSELLSSSPAAVLVGDKVIEVRPVGVSKGQIVGPIAERVPEGTAWVAIGDDTTDEELFAALPEGGIAIHVGSRPSRARYRLSDVAAVRALLASLVPTVPT